MKVLVACEMSGRVTTEFRRLGHEAYSCDVLPTEGNAAWHIQDDVLKHLNDGWDMMIGHPPCTYLARVGIQYLYKDPSRWSKMLQGRAFFLALWSAPVKKIVLENPVPHRFASLPPHSQTIQPYEYGHAASKRTLLWLKNVPPLMATNLVADRGEVYQHPGGGHANQKWYSNANSTERAKTFPGIARAMAEQWGTL